MKDNIFGLIRLIVRINSFASANQTATRNFYVRSPVLVIHLSCCKYLTNRRAQIIYDHNWFARRWYENAVFT
jgi:hypothetical protein